MKSLSNDLCPRIYVLDDESRHTTHSWESPSKYTRVLEREHLLKELSAQRISRFVYRRS